MQIKVTIRDKKGTNFVKSEIRRVTIMKDLDLERIAKECEKIIGDTIQNKAKDSKGLLASYLYAHKVNNNSWAVGDIPELDREVKHWNHIDKGSEAIGADWNHYLPKGRWVNGRWVIDSSGYNAKPKTPISAMNYISDTVAQMEMIIPQILKG